MKRIWTVVFIAVLSCLWSISQAQPVVVCPDQTTRFEYDTLERCVIHFRHDRAAIDSNYMANSASLSAIRAALKKVAEESPESLASIIIEGASSPIGHEVYNQRLSLRRAKKAEAFLRTIPGLKDVDMMVVGKGEDWQTFTVGIKASYSRRNREALISILDQDIPSAEKKKKIMALDSDSITWRYLVKNYMTTSRQVVTIVVVKEKRIVDMLPLLTTPTAQAVAVRQSGLASYGEVAPVSVVPSRKAFRSKKSVVQSEPSIASEQSVASYSSVASDTPESSQPSESSEESSSSLPPIATVRTNLLVPALNVGAELPIGNNWSVAADYYFPWIWPGQKNKNCFEFLGWSAEGRYWFGRNRQAGDRLKGHSVGVYIAGGYYDFEKSYRGMQGEFVSPGVDYTYSMAIGRKKNLHLQFTVAAGYIRSWGRTYNVYGDYGQLYPDEGTVIWDYFGPTKAAVTLVVPFYKKEGRK